MPKVKLTVSEIEKFKQACEATDIQIVDEKSYGKTTVLVVNIKHPSQLYNAGLIQASIEVLTKEDDVIILAETQGYIEPIKGVKKQNTTKD